MADAESSRRGFMSRAPELRASLVAELGPLLPRVPGLDEDQTAVLQQILAYAGLAEDGRLLVPSFAALWGGEASYVPAVALPPGRVKAAVKILIRRGILTAVPAGDLPPAAALDHERLRSLAVR